MFRCINLNGVIIYEVLPSQKCWNGYHFLYLSFGIISSITATAVGIINCMFFNEISEDNLNVFQIHSIDFNVLFIATKIIICISFLFSYNDEAQFFPIVIVVFSLLCFINLKMHSPYYNENINLVK